MMKHRPRTAATMGAKEFLKQNCPNMSLKEQNSLEFLIQNAVKGYLDENLTLKPSPRISQAPIQPSTTLFFPGKFQTTRFLEDEDDTERLQISGNFCGEYTTSTPRFLNSYNKPTPRTGMQNRARTAHPTARKAQLFQNGANTQSLMTENEKRIEESVSPLPAVQLSLNEQVEKNKCEETPAEVPDNEYPEPRTSADILTWRATTPFYESDRSLKAYRHQQNPRKPLPLDLLPNSLRPESRSNLHLSTPSRPKTASPYKTLRPHTARPGVVYPQEVFLSHSLDMKGQKDIETGIKSWLGNANDYEKKIAFNLMKALDTGKREGLEGQEMEALPYVMYKEPTNGRRRPVTPLEHYFPNGKRSDPRILFGGIEDEFKRAQKKSTGNKNVPKDYIHPGACALNTSPQYRAHFVIHPDWVSERARPKMAPAVKANATSFRYGSK